MAAKPETQNTDKPADKPAEKADKPQVLSESKTHRVLMDAKRVWKEAK